MSDVMANAFDKIMALRFGTLKIERRMTVEANSVMGKHEFVITVSNILPEFKSLPDWQKKRILTVFS